MAQIFIAITVDAITLAASKTGGSWDAPISLGSYSASDVYVEMMTQGSALVNDQGGSELTVSADVGDEIIFTISAPAAGQNYYPVLYNTVLNNNNVRSLGPNTAVWTNYCLQSGGSGNQPKFASTVPTNYPNAGNPNTFICAQWLFQVNGAGSTQYNMSFAVLDTQNGSVIGYYLWDPFITISN
ncbi:AidA/PixA family protein [Fluviicola sp.]|uniref:AidA/PixA family protein n=1 Tax=Fluviicola sp. TaxID=1917219 RepID=UPI00260E555D|nr:AidA/PixA family protein [Fluviicola sp.]